MAKFCSESDYHTPADTQKAVLARLLPSSRLYFYAAMFRQVLLYRSHIQKKKAPPEEFIWRSEGIANGVEKCGGKMHFTGFANIRQTAGPVVFVGNHMSSLETFLLPALILPLKPITFIVKDSLVRHPVFGPVMRWQNPIVVSRDNPREDFKIVMNEGARALQDGRSVIVFPQSTRQDYFDESKFNSIGAKLAQRNETPIIPVAVKTDFWGNGKLVRDLGPVDPHKEVQVKFGPAIAAGPAREMQKQILAFLQENLCAWGVEWRQEVQ